MTQKEYRKLSQLKNWDKNPRNIKEKDFERLKTQIRDLGQYKPLLITADGTVLGGNMRLRAYNALGMDDIWVSVVDAPDEEAKMRYALSDNDRAGYYDGDMLANLTGEYPDFEWDQYAVDLAEPQTLADLIKSLAPIEEDDVPEVSDEPAVSELGEVYQLGRHRLMCGDATKIEDVEKLMDGQKADMVFTDPPYGMDFQSNFREKTPQFEKLKNDDVVLEVSPVIYSYLNDNAVAYICTRWDMYPQWFSQVKNSGFNIKNCIVWYKKGGGLGDLENSYLPNHEFIIVAHKGQGALRGKRDADVWQIERDGFNSYDHPTQKPVALPAFAITHHSDDGGILLDLFGGSGSTLIACEQTNRTCYTMELDPKYCDVIRKRYENFTNK